MTTRQAWHEAAQHLVQGHFAEPGEFARYVPCLAELHETHDAAHAYPTSFPSDGHKHDGQLPGGDPQYAPFMPVVGARGDFAPWPFPNPRIPGEVEWWDSYQRDKSAGADAPDPEAEP